MMFRDIDDDRSGRAPYICIAASARYGFGLEAMPERWTRQHVIPRS